jgi:hypothetical protein
MVLHEFSQGFSVTLRETVSQKVTDLVSCSRSVFVTKETEGNAYRKRGRSLPEWRLPGMRVEIASDSYICLYIRRDLYSPY